MSEKISAVILAKDEEKNIEDCIKRLGWSDEVVVIDDNSVDDTVSVARKLGAKVISRELKNNFSNQRNFALGQAENDWIFFVDADERVSDELKAEIQQKLLKKESEDINGFLMRRRDTLWGRHLIHGDVKNTYLLRLGRKNKGKWTGAVHETWEIDGRVEKLTNALMHSPHESVEGFLKKINFYSSIRADELYAQKIPVTFLDIIFYPLGKFLLNYIWKRGFLDGSRGMIHALLMSFYSYMVRAKLWLLYHKKTHAS